MGLDIFKKKIQYDFLKEEEFHLAFKHDAGFRINQFNILSVKYNLPVSAVYAKWRDNGRCSYIKLENIIRWRIVL